MYCNTVEKNPSLTSPPWIMGCPGLVARMTVLCDGWPSAVHQLLFNDLQEVCTSSVRDWQDGIQQCHQTDFRGKTHCQGIDYKILAQCHLEHPNGTLTNGLRTHAAYIKNFLKKPHRIQHRQIRRSLKYHCRQFVEKYARLRDTSIFWHPDVVATFPDLLELTKLPRIFNETYLKNSWLYPEYSYTL